MVFTDIQRQTVYDRYQSIVDGSCSPELRQEAHEHNRQLRNAMNGLLDPPARVDAMNKCRRYLERGVPCVNRYTDLSAWSSAAHQFLQDAWPPGSHEAIAALMCDYRAAGHLPLDVSLPAFKTAGVRADRDVAPQPLEASVLVGNIPAMLKLLELGAPYDGDLLEFIAAQGFIINRAAVHAAATGWFMDRKLAEGARQASVVSVPAVDRARRML